MSDSANPWTAACQASLSINNSRSLLKLMCVESVILSNHLILGCTLLLPPPIFPSIKIFQQLVWVGGEGNGNPLKYSCLENPMDGGAWWAAVHGVAKSRTWLSDFTFTFHFHSLEEEMATHSSVLAWRIPGTTGPGGLLSMGSHRVGHNWSYLAAVAAVWVGDKMEKKKKKERERESVLWLKHQDPQVEFKSDERGKKFS